MLRKPDQFNANEYNVQTSKHRNFVAAPKSYNRVQAKILQAGDVQVLLNFTK